MNRFTPILLLAACLLKGHVQAQSDIQQQPINRVDSSKLEGVTLRNGHSLMLVVSNLILKKSGDNHDKVAATDQFLASTLIQKIGTFEIHKFDQGATITDKRTPSFQGFLIQGKRIPAFAETGAGQDFIGSAYLHDIKKMGLISNEVAVKFNTSTVPARYTGLGAKELVKDSGLYFFVVNDIYAWLKLVSTLQEDLQVNLVEPHIVTEFDIPN